MKKILIFTILLFFSASIGINNSYAGGHTPEYVANYMSQNANELKNKIDNIFVKTKKQLKNKNDNTKKQLYNRIITNVNSYLNKIPSEYSSSFNDYWEKYTIVLHYIKIKCDYEISAIDDANLVDLDGIFGDVDDGEKDEVVVMNIFTTDDIYNINSQEDLNTLGEFKISSDKQVYFDDFSMELYGSDNFFIKDVILKDESGKVVARSSGPNDVDNEATINFYQGDIYNGGTYKISLSPGVYKILGHISSGTDNKISTTLDLEASKGYTITDNSDYELSTIYLEENLATVSIECVSHKGEVMKSGDIIYIDSEGHGPNPPTCYAYGKDIDGDKFSMELFIYPTIYNNGDTVKGDFYKNGKLEMDGILVEGNIYIGAKVIQNGKNVDTENFYYTVKKTTPPTNIIDLNIKCINSNTKGGNDINNGDTLYIENDPEISCIAVGKDNSGDKFDMDFTVYTSKTDGKVNGTYEGKGVLDLNGFIDLGKVYFLANLYKDGKLLKQATFTYYIDTNINPDISISLPEYVNYGEVFNVSWNVKGALECDGQGDAIIVPDSNYTWNDLTLGASGTYKLIAKHRDIPDVTSLEIGLRCKFPGNKYESKFGTIKVLRNETRVDISLASYNPKKYIYQNTDENWLGAYDINIEGEDLKLNSIKLKGIGNFKDSDIKKLEIRDKNNVILGKGYLSNGEIKLYTETIFKAGKENYLHIYIDVSKNANIGNIIGFEIIGIDLEDIETGDNIENIDGLGIVETPIYKIIQ